MFFNSYQHNCTKGNMIYYVLFKLVLPKNGLLILEKLRVSFHVSEANISRRKNFNATVEIQYSMDSFQSICILYATQMDNIDSTLKDLVCYSTKYQR